MVNSEDEEYTDATQPIRLAQGISLNDVLGHGAEMELDQNYYDFDVKESLETDHNVSDNEEELIDFRKFRHEERVKFETLGETMESMDPNGFLKKEIVKKGYGPLVPDRSLVTLEFNFYHEEDIAPYDSSYRKGKPFSFRLGSTDVHPVLDQAVRTMQKKEMACFIIHWKLGFGELGCPPRIPKRAMLMYQIHLTDFEECPALIGSVDPDVMDFDRSITSAKRLHQLGNEIFKQGNHAGAMKNYFKATKLLNSLRLANEEEESEMLMVKRKCHNNIAVVALKQHKPELACTHCQAVLSIDRKNVKALCNYGKAALMLSDFDQAKKWLLKAKAIEPNNKEILESIETLNKKKKDYDLKFKNICRKYFNEDLVKEEEPQQFPEDNVFESFEENLKQSLEEILSDPDMSTMKLPFELTDEEKKICDKIAAGMGCVFESTHKGNVIKMVKH